MDSGGSTPSGLTTSGTAGRLDFLDPDPVAAEAPFFAPGAAVFPSLPTAFANGFAPGFPATAFTGITFAATTFAAATFAATGFAANGFTAGPAEDFATTFTAAFAAGLMPDFAVGRDEGLDGSRFFELAGGLRAAVFATGRTRGFAAFAFAFAFAAFAFAFARTPDLREVAMSHPS